MTRQGTVFRFTCTVSVILHDFNVCHSNPKRVVPGRRIKVKFDRITTIRQVSTIALCEGMKISETRWDPLVFTTIF